MPGGQSRDGRVCRPSESDFSAVQEGPHDMPEFSPIPCRVTWQKYCLVFVCLCVSREAGAAEPRPNIVFILADDLGYRELGCFGQEKIRTPRIDQLARQGMRLTQHYAGSAVCAPSRCVLMTGKHPGHAYVRDNRSTPPEGQIPIPDSEVTIGELLKARGYACGVFGKWGLGGPASSGIPQRQGFDRFFGYLCQAHAHSYYPAWLRSGEDQFSLKNDPPVKGHDGLDPGADPNDPVSYRRFQGQEYAPDRINEQVLDFIRSSKDRPFFCYYPTVIPHVALHIPDEDLRPYHDLNWNDPPFTRANGRGYTPHFTPRAAYAAMITRLDTYIGRVLDLLDELQLSDNTIVIFTSDNGTTHLKQEVDYDFFNSVGELRGLKGSLYEGGIRVPGIVRWPGRVAEGSTSDFISGFEDWLPTLMDVVGHLGDTPSDCDGISLRPALQGQPAKPRAFLYREFAGYGGQQSIRRGRWKAVRQKLRHGTVRTELYDLKADPREQHDRAAAEPTILAQLEELLEKQHGRSPQFPIPVLDRP